MIRSLFVFVVSFLLFAGNGYSEELKSVVAVGYGETHKEAVQDSLRNAVMQVVGSFVSATTIISNGDLIKDNILTYSDGLVEGYKENATKREDGLFVTELNVNVKVQELSKKLEGLNLIKVSFEINKKEIEADIKTDEFNLENLKELNAAFNDVVIKPLITGKAHNIKFISKGIYKDISKYQSNHNKYGDTPSTLSFNATNISTNKKESFKLYNSDAGYPKWAREYRDKSTREKHTKGKYLVFVKYTNRLSKSYIKSVHRFFDKVSYETVKGYNKKELRTIKDDKYISVVKMSHLLKRNMFTKLYKFDSKKFSSLSTYSIMNKPELVISLLDEDDIPIIKNSQTRNPTSNPIRYSSCSEEENYKILICGATEFTLKNILSPMFAAIGSSSIVNYFYKSNKLNTLDSFLIIDNDSVNFTTIFLVDKEAALDIKNVQIELKFSEPLGD